MSNNERMFINRRSLEEAFYIVSKNANLEETANVFNVSIEDVYIDVTQRINKESILYKKVNEILQTDSYYISKKELFNEMPISVRSREVGMFMVTQNASLEEAAKAFGITIEDAYIDVTEVLNKDTNLYKMAIEIVRNDSKNSYVRVHKRK